MNYEDRKKFTCIRKLFVGVPYVSKKNLLKVLTNKDIDEALEKGLIEVCGTNDINDTQYRLTDEGKKL